MQMILLIMFRVLLSLVHMPVAAVAQATATPADKAVRSALDMAGGKPGQPTADGPGPDAVVAELQSKRAAAEKELNEIKYPEPSRKGAPAGTTDARVMERRANIERNQMG